jgi:hypothetical protein
MAWSLLLGGAAASFVLAVFLTNRDIGGAIVIANRDYGLLENWALALIALSVGGCVYVLRGAYGGGWSVSASGLGVIGAAALSLLLFGECGLLALAAAALVVGPLLVGMRRSGI